MIRYSTRVVILIFGMAIKIPVSKRGWVQCKNERRMWEKYKHLNVLGTLHWEFGGIVCMKRYKEAKVLESTKVAHRFIDTVLETKRRIPEFDIERCDLYRAENWGMEGERYVLIDYGINEEVSNMYQNHK